MLLSLAPLPELSWRGSKSFPPRLTIAMRFAIICGVLFSSVTAIPISGRHLCAQQATLQVEAEPRTYMGRQIARTMSYHGADWLVRNSREREEQPQKLLDALEIKPGQQVCDFGCGNGYHSLRIAQLVGAKGKVLAVDIQQEMLDMLSERCKTREVDNVDPILATTDDPQLPPGQIDLVLMVDVYHELSYPAEILGAIRKKLKPTGRIALVEFREEDPTVPIKPLHKMSQAQAIREFAGNGFKLVGQFDRLPWQHVLFFARDDSRLPSVQLVPWQQNVAPQVKSPDREN